MGRRRSTKTGDKALYAKRNEKSIDLPQDDDSDDEVDAFHKRREMEADQILFDDPSRRRRGESDDESDREEYEGVFNLKVENESSDDDDDESDDDDSSSDGAGKARGSGGTDDHSSSDEESVSSDDDDDMERLRSALAANVDPSNEDLLKWGKKNSYYHGDTADLEIGQDEDDAFLEEEAAKQVLKARYQEMDEDDFGIDDNEANDDDANLATKSSQTKEVKKGKQTATLADVLSVIPASSVDQLSIATKKTEPKTDEEKLQLISSQNPELLPIVEHFKGIAVDELLNRVLPVSEQLVSDENTAAVGTTKLGKDYLRDKQMLLLSAALNCSTYLLLKCDGVSDVGNHPIIARLNACDEAVTKMNENVEKPLMLDNQLDALVKATTLMNGGEISDDSSAAEEDDLGEMDTGESENETMDEKSDSASSSDESDIEEDDLARHKLKNEARFSVRPQDIDGGQSGKKRRKRSSNIAMEDIGDDMDEERAALAMKGLSATMNTIAQKERTAARRATVSAGNAEEEKKKIDDEKLKQGLALMEQMIGKGSDDESDDEDNELSDGLESEGDDFYESIKKKKRAKREMKKSMYEVAPKYPTLEKTIDGERALSKKIMKNRGLVPHKPKINRNPRVKKREQYRKALIRRKGAVREVRTGETANYGGEETGIKSGISRSRKLGVKY
eukprot:CAMPEP_0116049060 /NCGR_PEP_ID=MMETSP0321-20121206/29956_1 /TAXON_ID=163516 /ORGANISM="Leptocylindrus danicus var. danicus, Strain B650" /LENGTH=675 /DNA_ID=CAMNT_0003531447 /DNA_START=30 /DNA_END=2054 /DNA_ORIENTATION=+